ncbi:hypothetical protein [Aurantimonas sp. VKM B-3413]|uniref:hypothetical protein n=1 Tax=Aurantimonas sp. VKM B-3413 TaxID=2779401 RepID=UPI001E2C6398|nr:hypothetical protein [Aurantimonas sp. VKM B-3413]MCB8839786.1 hypothetical protein [Aurantimonas sp. VKM B-3413]
MSAPTGDGGNGGGERDPETLIRSDRLDEVRKAYAAIARQIAILRSLDLGETHPAVVFRPTGKEDPQ